jgi:hypothetical protein
MGSSGDTLVLGSWNFLFSCGSYKKEYQANCVAYMLHVF